MFHLWGFWLMALTFNMHLFTAPNAFLFLGYLQWAQPTSPAHCKERWKVWWGKGSEGTCSWMEPFLLLSFASLMSWNPGTSLTWNVVMWVCPWEGGYPPATGDGHQLWQAWGFPFAWQASGPHSFRDPLELFSHLGANQHHVLVQNMARKRREPLFWEKQTNNGLSKSFVVCLAGPGSLFFPSSAQR